MIVVSLLSPLLPSVVTRMWSGALKAAHVGISIINNPEFERRVQASFLQSNQQGERRSQRGLRATLELHHQQEDPTIVKLGDASIASPFTARRTSIECISTVLRLGRCTLVTTIQVCPRLAILAQCSPPPLSVCRCTRCWR